MTQMTLKEMSTQAWWDARITDVVRGLFIRAAAAADDRESYMAFVDKTLRDWPEVGLKDLGDGLVELRPGGSWVGDEFIAPAFGGKTFVVTLGSLPPGASVTVVDKPTGGTP